MELDATYVALERAAIHDDVFVADFVVPGGDLCNLIATATCTVPPACAASLVHRGNKGDVIAVHLPLGIVCQVANVIPDDLWTDGDAYPLFNRVHG